MHGVRKGSRVLREDELEVERFYRDLISKALDLRKHRRYDAESLRIIARALEHNPDEYSLWNARKEALTEEVGSVSGIRFHEEMELTEKALRRHPKGYGAWQHRLWLLAEVETDPDVKRSAWIRENAVCNEMISADERNFHAWAHRMMVRRLDDEEDAVETELAMTLERIRVNFANYSAWHYRSRALSSRNDDGSARDEELEMLQQAFFTEPAVQSAWFYYDWVMSGGPRVGEQGDVTFLFSIDDAVVTREMERLDELIELEPEAVFARRAKAGLLGKVGRADEAAKILERLGDLDPLRKGCYRDLLDRIRSV